MHAAAIAAMIGAVTAAGWAASAGGGTAGRTMVLATRRWAPGPGGDLAVERRQVVWEGPRTAAIICDMWDRHWCQGATARVAELAPRVNELLDAARATGALIIHAPSDTMAAYRDHPGRRLAQAAPQAANVPAGIDQWCRQIDSEKGVAWPIDQSDGGCDCQPTCKQGSAWRRQIDAIAIRDGDAISDSGREVWNLLEQRGIKNVLLMGVHTNMCVLGRPFGLRNLARNGKNVVLVRDLTDTMYNSRRSPLVSHFRGTDLVVEYIEKLICPTVLSSDLTGKPPLRFAADRRGQVLPALAEPEYKTLRTLPEWASRSLANKRDFRVEIICGRMEAGRDLMPGFADELGRSDLLILSMRRRALPAADLAALRSHLQAGKPLVALRTSSHAFDTKGKHPDGHEEWPTFDRDVLGCHYTGHHGAGQAVTITIAPGAEGHPILAGLTGPFTSKGSLYKSSPLVEGATALLVGRIDGAEPEPVAWTRLCGKARVFYTSLGHWDDFGGQDPPLARLLTNAVFWALDRPAPEPRTQPATPPATQP